MSNCIVHHLLGFFRFYYHYYYLPLFLYFTSFSIIKLVLSQCTGFTSMLLLIPLNWRGKKVGVRRVSVWCFISRWIWNHDRCWSSNSSLNCFQHWRKKNRTSFYFPFSHGIVLATALCKCKGHQDDPRDEASLLWGKAERTVFIQHGKEKFLGTLLVSFWYLKAAYKRDKEGLFTRTCRDRMREMASHWKREGLN